jgi:PAS domain S-box-containing protein
MHKSLLRQLKQILGQPGPEDIDALVGKAVQAAATPGLDPAVAGLLENFGDLLRRVESNYVQFDRDLELRTRSLELSSEELTRANDQLREDIAARSRAVKSLRSTISEILGEQGIGGVGADDELESLSRIVANLVAEREKQRIHLDNLKFALDQHAIVSITDPDGMIIYANEKFCEISGYFRDELIGKNHRIVKSGRHPNAFFEQLWKTITAGKVWHGEISNRSKSGEEYWVAATIVPFLDEAGRPYEYTAIRTDITARKQAEDALIQARDAAEAANRAKSAFLANMSHEIRTPMNGIIGMTNLALDTELDTEQREYLQIVRSSAESLLTVINDILDFSKIEAGKLHVEKVGFDLRQTIDETLKVLELRAAEKGLPLRCQVAEAVPTRVVGDPLRLKQVLLNLVGNAIKFTEMGSVSVSADVQSHSTDAITVTIVVRDTGIGIPAEKLGDIFEAFAQADSSTTRHYGGTGLGLTISNRLVNLMGGTMTVESTVGVGSEFSFSLPMGIGSASASSQQAQTTQEVAPGSTLNVLLVEDNPVNQQVALRFLEKWGHRVTLASNGLEAVDRVAAGHFDVVLMDMQMPVMGGIEATQRIRAREAANDLPHLRIVAMTANAMQGDREACLAAGMDDYLAKPISANDLAAKLGYVNAEEGQRSSYAHAAAVFDYSLALEEMDEEILVLIIPLFLESYGQELDAIAKACAANDAPTIARLAHTLKGTLSAFSAEPAQRRAAEMELLAKGGQVADAVQMQDALCREVEALASALRDRLS